MRRCYEMQAFASKCYEKVRLQAHFEDFTKPVNQGVLGSSPRGGAKTGQLQSGFFMYFIYILYSATSDMYYVGFSEDPFRRLKEHNTAEEITFTSKHRPWQLKSIFEVGDSRAEAMHIEKFIKKQKSRRLLELLCDEQFLPKGELSGLVRVPIS